MRDVKARETEEDYYKPKSSEKDREEHSMMGKNVPRSQTDIGFSLPSVSHIIFHLYSECPCTPLTLPFHLSIFISSLTYNFVFTAPTLLLEPIIFVFAVNVTRLVFPIKHSRARCLCYLSDYALFVFVLIFKSFANMKCLKGFIQPIN